MSRSSVRPAGRLARLKAAAIMTGCGQARKSTQSERAPVAQTESCAELVA